MMKILVKKPFVEVTTRVSYRMNKEYTVDNKFGQEMCRIGFAIEVKEEIKEKKTPAKNTKKAKKNEA